MTPPPAEETDARPRAVVLIVDDRPENLLALEAVLEPLDVAVERAGSGEGALRRLLAEDAEDVTVIILDVQMPGMDGFETADAIKSRERTRHIPIVFLTAISTEIGHALRGYASGAVDYVAKPFEPDVLRAKVSVLVDLQQHARTIAEQRALLAQRLDERNRAQAKLARQTLELERSNADLEHFATLLSTELRGPMNLVAGFLDLLAARHGDDLTGDGRELLDHAQDAADRLGTRVEQLLAYATVTTDGRQPEAVSLDEVFEEVAATVAARVEAAGATLTADPLPDVLGDRWQLVRLLTHLVENALIHTQAGVDVHLAVSRRDGNWVVSVRDDGPGLAPELRTSLFTLLGRPLDPADSVAGNDGDGDGDGWTPGRRPTGVGLAVARRIVELHGGTIWADSVPGQGTTVSFTLPPAPVPAATRERP
jgi:signal transduction histidine kinase